ncbi:MAG: CHAT domain-containing protein, partial [Terriglobales bacterium]
VADMLVNLGEVDLLEGNWAQALERYRESLSLREAAADKNSIAYTLNNIGDAHFAQRDYAQALQHYEKSLALRQTMGDLPGLAQTLNSMAMVHAQREEYGQAFELASRAAGMAREIGSHEALWPALTTAARAHRALNQPARAREALEEAIATIESLRSQVAGGEQEQQRFFENKLAPYYGMVELLLGQDQAAEAFAYAERAKARTLLDVLRSGRLQLTPSMTAEDQEQERRLAAELISLDAQLAGERQRSQPDRIRLADLGARLQKARLDLDGFQTSLYRAHPDLKNRRGEVRPLAAPQARELLPENGVLLKYAVTEQKTFLFVLEKDQPEVRAYTIHTPAGELARRINRFRGRLASRDLAIQDSARELYHLLLGPARTQLSGKTTLVIVPDSALWELPFQALQRTAGRYLIEEHAIFYTPSATVWGEMARVRKRREADLGASATLLAMGNPVLGARALQRVRMLLTDQTLDPLP